MYFKKVFGHPTLRVLCSQLSCFVPRRGFKIAMLVTLAVFHAPMSWLKAAAPNTPGLAGLILTYANATTALSPEPGRIQGRLGGPC